MTKVTNHLPALLLLSGLATSVLQAHPPKWMDDSTSSSSAGTSSAASAASSSSASAAAPLRPWSNRPEAPNAFATYSNAFRADLANPDHPMFLGLDEAQLLAGLLGIGVEIFSHVEYRNASSGRPSAQAFQDIAQVALYNPELLDDFSTLRLLYHARHFCLIETPEDHQPGQYLHTTEGDSVAYVETGEQGPPMRLVPPDGDCLITSMAFMANGWFPHPTETASYRQLIAQGLSDTQITNALEDMYLDLTQRASEFPLENGRFGGWGLETSRLLLADRQFMADRERALGPYHLQATQVFRSAASPSPVDLGPCPMDLDKGETQEDEEELKACIALSMRLN